MPTVPGTPAPTRQDMPVKPTLSDMMMAAAIMHRRTELDPSRFDQSANVKIKQTERPLYPVKGKEDETYEGPMKLTPGSKADPEAVGWTGSVK